MKIITSLLLLCILLACKPMPPEPVFPLGCPDSFLSVTLDYSADFVMIPDSNFEEQLIYYGIDSDGLENGKILMKDALACTQLIVFGKHVAYPSLAIFSLKGIEYFKNLNALSIGNCLVDSIDLSHNINLEKISYSDYSGIGGRNYPDEFKSLKYMNLGENDQLEELSISLVLIKELDLSGVPNLKKFSVSMDKLNTIYLANEEQKNIDWHVEEWFGVDVNYKICKR
jgi:hypothetical protein